MRNIPPGRGSTSTKAAIQIFMRSGSVNKANTVSGDASIWISRRTSRSSRSSSAIGLAPFGRLGSPLQPLQPRAPKSLDVCDQLVKPFVSHHIEALWADPAFVEKTGVAQYADMLRNGRPRQLEALGDRAGRHLSLANEVYD